MSSSIRQRRMVVAILLSTLGLTGVLIAQGTMQLVGAALLPLDPGAAVALGRVEPAPRQRYDGTPILQRNIFDSESGDLSREPEPPRDETETEPEPPVVAAVYDPNGPPPPPCDGSMRLVGAFVRMRDPEDSFAAITDSTGQSLLYQEGMSVDDREVVAIQASRVVLRPRSGSLCSLSMFGEVPRVATAQQAEDDDEPRVTVSPAPRGPTPEGLDPATLESSIQQISEREYSIDRSLVTSLLANQAALMRTARVIPHEEGGRVVGVKLYGIRRSSLLGRLGIQNGDMLRTINGYDMTSPDSALEAYARLQNADRITVNLARRGSDMTIDYQIR